MQRLFKMQIIFGEKENRNPESYHTSLQNKLLFQKSVHPLFPLKIENGNYSLTDCDLVYF